MNTSAKRTFINIFFHGVFMVQKKHRTWAMLWLVIMVIGNALSFLSYLFGGTALRNVMGYPLWSIILLGALSACNVVIAIALLKWKKWGFYAFILSAVASFCVNLALPIHFIIVVLGLLGPALLWYFIQHEWKEYV